MRKLTLREKYGLILIGLILLAALGYRFGSPVIKKWQNFDREMKRARQDLEKIERLAALEPSVKGVEDELRIKSGFPKISEDQEIRSLIIKHLDETAKKSGVQAIDQLNAKPNPAKKREKISSEVKGAFIDQLHVYEVKEDKEDKENKLEPMEPIFPPLPDDLPNDLKTELEKKISEAGTLNQTEVAELVAKYKAQETGTSKTSETPERLVAEIESYQRAVLKKKAELRKLLNEVDTSYDKKSFSITLSFKSEIEPLVKFIYNLENSSRWIKVEAIKVSISDPKKAILSAELSLMATIL